MLLVAQPQIFFELALKHDYKRADYGMEQIGTIYSVETIAKEEDASYECPTPTGTGLSHHLRLVGMALNEKDAVMPKSPIGKASEYLLGYIRQLSRYNTDGRWRIRSIIPIILENSTRF